jgi:hypothetical protein
VGDEEDRLAELGLQPEELVLELLADDRVHRAERLVHEHHRRVGGERPSHSDALLLAARELVGVPPGVRLVQPDPFEELEAPLARLPLVPAEEPRDRGDVVGHRAVREQPCVLDHVADAAAQLCRLHRRGVLPVDRDPTGGRLDHPVDHAERGRLAASGRADQDRDLPGWRLQLQPTHGDRAVRVDLGHAVEADHASDPTTTVVTWTITMIVAATKNRRPTVADGGCNNDRAAQLYALRAATSKPPQASVRGVLHHLKGSADGHLAVRQPVAR